MIGRRTFLAGTGAVLLAARLGAEAQQKGKIPRIGYLFVGSVPSPEDIAKGVATNPILKTNPFWMGMKELGWVEGQNLIVEWRGGQSADQLRAGAADLVRLKVDVLVVLGLGLAGIAQLETKTIPIVIQNAGG